MSFSRGSLLVFGSMLRTQLNCGAHETEKKAPIIVCVCIVNKKRTVDLHTLKELDDNLWWRSDKHLSATALLGIWDSLETIGEYWHAHHLDKREKGSGTLKVEMKSEVSENEMWGSKFKVVVDLLPTTWTRVVCASCDMPKTIQIFDHGANSWFSLLPAFSFVASHPIQFFDCCLSPMRLFRFD